MFHLLHFSCNIFWHFTWRLSLCFINPPVWLKCHLPYRILQKNSSNGSSNKMLQFSVFLFLAVLMPSTGNIQTCLRGAGHKPRPTRERYLKECTIYAKCKYCKIVLKIRLYVTNRLCVDAFVNRGSWRITSYFIICSHN